MRIKLSNRGLETHKKMKSNFKETFFLVFLYLDSIYDYQILFGENFLRGKSWSTHFIAFKETAAPIRASKIQLWTLAVHTLVT